MDQICMNVCVFLSCILSIHSTTDRPTTFIHPPSAEHSSYTRCCLCCCFFLHTKYTENSHPNHSTVVRAFQRTFNVWGDCTHITQTLHSRLTPQLSDWVDDDDGGQLAINHIDMKSPSEKCPTHKLSATTHIWSFIWFSEHLIKDLFTHTANSTIHKNHTFIICQKSQ